MNNDQYKEALRTAQKLEFKVRDLIDDKQHPLCQTLISESRRIVDELENKKNPRSVEDRIKGIIQTLHHIEQAGDQLMDYRHGNQLHDEYEHFQMSLRKFDNY